MPSQHFAFHLCPSCQASYNMDFDIHTRCKHSLLGLLAPAVQLCPRGRSSGECGNAGGWLCLEDMLDLNPNRTGGCAARYESPESALSIIDSHPASPLSPVGDLKVDGEACDRSPPVIGEGRGHSTSLRNPLS